MSESQTDLIAVIRRSLRASAEAGVATCFPTLLLERPGLHLVKEKVAAADAAIAYYSCRGFEADRTRMNLFGYPGMLRDLGSPRPWVEVEPEDMDEDISTERLQELRPLIEHAQETSEDALVGEWMANRDHRNRARHIMDIETAPSVVTAEGAESFRRLVALGKVLGAETFKAIWQAVFDFDEFTPASGAPDLLVWLPKGDPALWFFSEVKGPGDSLRSSQTAWLHQHGELVRGHYLLTILE
jgi:hypothetical protein